MKNKNITKNIFLALALIGISFGSSLGVRIKYIKDDVEKYLELALDKKKIISKIKLMDSSIQIKYEGGITEIVHENNNRKVIITKKDGKTEKLNLTSQDMIDLEAERLGQQPEEQTTTKQPVEEEISMEEVTAGEEKELEEETTAEEERPVEEMDVDKTTTTTTTKEEQETEKAVGNTNGNAVEQQPIESVTNIDRGVVALGGAGVAIFPEVLAYASGNVLAGIPLTVIRMTLSGGIAYGLSHTPQGTRAIKTAKKAIKKARKKFSSRFQRRADQDPQG